MNQASSAASDRNIQLSDITTNNASTTKHGFLPKLNNTATNFLDMTGTQRALTLTDLPTGTLVQEVGNVSGATASGTTTIPYDDTIPQITEGTEFFTQAITPKATTDILEIQCTIVCAVGVAGRATMALFQDATANALAATATYNGTANGEMMLTLTHRMAAGTTSATTFRIRAGQDAAGTFYLNGTIAGRKFGGVLSSGIIIREIKA